MIMHRGAPGTWSRPSVQSTPPAGILGVNFTTPGRVIDIHTGAQHPAIAPPPTCHTCPPPPAPSADTGIWRLTLQRRLRVA